MIFDTIETATALLTLFVITRIAISIPPVRRLATRLLDGPPDVLHTDVQPGSGKGSVVERMKNLRLE